MTKKSGTAEQQPPSNGDLETCEAWRWAAPQLTSWGKPQKYDYDFFKSCKWTKSASKDLLNAGCLYEYARESHKFRCWLVLRHTPKRKRFWLPRLIGLEFKGSSAGHNHLFRSGWGTWLDNFAEDLIANKSFEKVFSANSSRVLKSLDAVDAYCLYPNAVELPGRYINYPGSQDVLIQICWRHYDNRQIGEEMRKFAADRRPQNEPEPKRTGKKRKSRVRADLKALSVLRIWKLHKRNPWERLRLVAKVCGYKNCKEEAAAYEERRKRWHAKEPMSNAAKVEMSDARDRACKLFECWFPWGKPSNFEASDRKGKVNLK